MAFQIIPANMRSGRGNLGLQRPSVLPVRDRTMQDLAMAANLVGQAYGAAETVGAPRLIQRAIGGMGQPQQPTMSAPSPLPTQEQYAPAMQDAFGTTQPQQERPPIWATPNPRDMGVRELPVSPQDVSAEKQAMAAMQEQHARAQQLQQMRELPQQVSEAFGADPT